MPAACVLGLHPAVSRLQRERKVRLDGTAVLQPPEGTPEHHLASGPAFLPPMLPMEAWLQRNPNYLCPLILEHSKEKACCLWPGPGVEGRRGGEGGAWERARCSPAGDREALLPSSAASSSPQNASLCCPPRWGALHGGVLAQTYLPGPPSSSVEKLKVCGGGGGVPAPPADCGVGKATTKEISGSKLNPPAGSEAWSELLQRCWGRGGPGG